MIYWVFLELQSHRPWKHLCLSEQHSHHLFLSSKSRLTRLVNGKDQFLWLLNGTNISDCSSNALHHLAKPAWGEWRDQRSPGRDGGALSSAHTGLGSPYRRASKGCFMLSHVCDHLHPAKPSSELQYCGLFLLHDNETSVTYQMMGILSPSHLYMLWETG